MILFTHRLLICLYVTIALTFICGQSALAQVDNGDIATIEQDEKNAPVDLQADELIHNDDEQSVTARGDVILIQNTREVRAEEITYFLEKDVVIASGNVAFTDTNGDKHFADRVAFNNTLKDGFVEGLRTLLTDDSQFWAKGGQYTRGQKVVMKDARYTPCIVCETTPNKDPLWQLRASKVTHNKEEQRIHYNNVRFEAKGVPLLYLPYLSHADGTVTQKSGFLSPSAGFSSDLGAFIENNYYWAIAQDKDLTVGVRAMTEDAPLGLLEYRQRFNNAAITAAGSFTYSGRTDSIGNVEVERDDALRGHVDLNGIWNINRTWRAGVDASYASDDQYLRQYDMSNEDILESEIYAERFVGRNYAVARLLAFQDLRVEEDARDEAEPNILPEIESSFLGEQGSVPLIGGRWRVDTSFLSLVRGDGQQDVNRAHLDLGWQRRLVSPIGLVSTLDLSAQNTIYDVHDRVSTTGGKNGQYTEARSYGVAHLTTGYPIAKRFDASQWVIEPLASVTLGSNLGDSRDIPNEDSRDAQIDTLNLFDANRFSGIDRIEDRSRTTYGLKTGLYADDGSNAYAFVGQSYRFNDEDTPFNAGSGLDDQDSDIVGQLSMNYQDNFTADYRFQLDNESLAPQRHEIDAMAAYKKFTLSTRYLYATSLEGTDIDETREQIRNSVSYDINDEWRIFGAARHDLGENPGLRTAHLGLDYMGQCVSWSVSGKRTLTSDTSGDNGTEIFLRLGLKNLGEFETSGFQLGDDDN